MKYECTDCALCGSFEDGYRVLCLSPDLPAEEVFGYFPVGDGDAENCPHFDEGSPEEWYGEKVKEALNCKGDDTTWEDIKEWCKADIAAAEAKLVALREKYKTSG